MCGRVSVCVSPFYSSIRKCVFAGFFFIIIFILCLQIVEIDCVSFLQPILPLLIFLFSSWCCGGLVPVRPLILPATGREVTFTKSVLWYLYLSPDDKLLNIDISRYVIEPILFVLIVAAASWSDTSIYCRRRNQRRHRTELSHWNQNGGQSGTSRRKPFSVDVSTVRCFDCEIVVVTYKKWLQSIITKIESGI